MTKTSIEEQIRKLQDLALMPPIFSKMNEMMQDPNVSLSALGTEISKDFGLTSRLLKLANSAFYGFPGNISTATQALILMGIEAVQGMIIATEVFEKLPKNYYRLTAHSMLVARVSREIAQKCELPRIEEIATAGLLHDIGKVVLILNDRSKFKQLLKQAQARIKAPREIENSMLGFDHAALGYHLAQTWNLPARLSTPIRFHHTPQLAKEYQKETCIVSVANLIVNAIGGGIQEDLILESIPNASFVQLDLDQTFIHEQALGILGVLDNTMTGI